MPYQDYLNRQPEVLVRSSQTESRASGLAVGRVEVWPPGSTSGQYLRQIIENSEFDVVIVRVSAEDFELPATLNSTKVVSYQADTLLYFRIDSKRLAVKPDACKRVTLSPLDQQEASPLISQVFAGYRNHYSASPELRRIDVVRAYQDWTQSVLETPNCAAFKATVSGDETVGVCVTDFRGESHSEILLAGIVPEARGHGLYRDMLRLVGLAAKSKGKESVVISTQAANVSVMKAWCALGFLPVMSLNTIHVVRRDVHEQTLSE